MSLGGYMEEELLDYIDKTSWYPTYQTIVLKGKVIRNGTEKCWLTLENILSSNISFKGKRVCDLGCFHGYFSFRAEDLGAKSVIGYDVNPKAKLVFDKIKEYNNSSAECIISDLDKDFVLPECDITLLLNTFHHVIFKHGEEGGKTLLGKIFTNTEEAVFEINEKEIPLVDSVAKEFNYKLTYHVNSHRDTMYGKRHIRIYTKL